MYVSMYYVVLVDSIQFEKTQDLKFQIDNTNSRPCKEGLTFYSHMILWMYQGMKVKLF